MVTRTTTTYRVNMKLRNTDNDDKIVSLSLGSLSIADSEDSDYEAHDARIFAVTEALEGVLKYPTTKVQETVVSDLTNVA